MFPGQIGDLDAWSGIPASLVRALEGLGVELFPVSSQPPRPLAGVLLTANALTRIPRTGGSSPSDALRHARRQARVAPAMLAVRNTVARQRLRRVGPVDAILQIHAECPLDGGVPFATYEDLTIAQALRHGYREWTRLSSRDQRRRVAQQGAVYRRAAACCTTTRWVRDSLVADYGIAPDRVHPVGIGCERPPITVDREWTTPRFLFVGLDWERKNGDAVVRAFARIRAANASAELHVVGGHPRLDRDGVVSHGRLRLGHSGERAQVLELYRRSTCFVMPSWVEPSAIAYLEAASSGLPTIATTVGGSADLVGDGGILVDPHDEEALVRAMEELCDPAGAQAMGALARARSALFTWPRVAARILTALEVPGFEEPPLSWA